MIIIRGLHNFKAMVPNLCLTIGNFDGLHLGHRKIIRHMLDNAKSMKGKGALFTFTPHPRWVLNPGVSTLFLTTLHEQVEILNRWGLDLLILARFNQYMAKMRPEPFVTEIIVKRLMARDIYVGEGFSFGHKRSGTLELLEDLGKKFGFSVHRVGLMKMNGALISSTLIRQKIQSGEIEEANRLLGYEYRLTGKVIRGTGRGWHMGFPTANLKVISKILPARGVYLVKVEIKGKTFPGIANLGQRPTFEKDAEMGVEVYILGLKNDIYGEKLTIHFQKWIRKEIAFPTQQDLINQIKDDIEKASKWIINYCIN